MIHLHVHVCFVDRNEQHTTIYIIITIKLQVAYEAETILPIFCLSESTDSFHHSSEHELRSFFVQAPLNEDSFNYSNFFLISG